MRVQDYEILSTKMNQTLVLHSKILKIYMILIIKILKKV